MGPLAELIATDHLQTLEFFFLHLQDITGPEVDRPELLYNASVLAHYAQISTQACVNMPAPSNLSEIFDNFVADASLLADSQMMETAGAQCLVLAGFFEDQMRRRHNIRWYAELGAVVLQPGRRFGSVPPQGPPSQYDCEAFRALAPASRPAQSRTARPALSAELAQAVETDVRTLDSASGVGRHSTTVPAPDLAGRLVRNLRRYFTSAGVEVAGPSPTISSTTSSSFAPS